MTWLTWRQFRIPAASVFAGLAVIGVFLVVAGIDLRGETNFSDQDFMFGATTVLMYLLPAALGVFWGVPMVTRELENGTHSLVWNQTITRKRWLANKLGVGVAAAVVAAGLLSLVVNWWASPIDAMTSVEEQSTSMTRMSPVVFAARGIAPVGYAAFAFVLGVALGLVLRRTVTAMAITLVVFAAVQVAVPFLVRPYVLPATEETVTITTDNIMQINGTEDGVIESLTTTPAAGAWELRNETIDPAGNVVSPLPDVVQNCLPGPGRQDGPPPRQNITECFAQLTDLGYRQRVVYHPGSQFWPMQWIELAFFLALSGLLTWFCFRRVRHLS